jgi:hypothetical protein
MKKMQVSKLALRKNTISNLSERSARMLMGGGDTVYTCGDTWDVTCPVTCYNSCGGTCFGPGCGGGTATTIPTRRTCPV